MRDAVAKSMRKSMDYILRYKDTILEALSASDLIPCEGSDSELAKRLDMTCGIDYVLVSGDGSLLKGVGCRFQEDRWAQKYNTFTIRKERDSGARTEFEKRKHAIKKGGLYPYLTMHGYIDTENDRIDRMAVAKTAELIDYCENCNPPVKHTGDWEDGQAEFYCVDWDEYKQSGRSIFIYHASS